jgi:hypothetical protein
MVSKEKGRRKGDPIPKVYVCQDNSESNPSPPHFQVFRRAAMAETLAPLVFMGAWQ